MLSDPRTERPLTLLMTLEVPVSIVMAGDTATFTN